MKLFDWLLIFYIMYINIDSKREDMKCGEVQKQY